MTAVPRENIAHEHSATTSDNGGIIENVRLKSDKMVSRLQSVILRVIVINLYHLEAPLAIDITYMS